MFTRLFNKASNMKVESKDKKVLKNELTVKLIADFQRYPNGRITPAGTILTVTKEFKDYLIENNLIEK